MTRTDLERLMTDAGHVPIVLAGAVVVLPYAGRVIGLFPTAEENALWANEAAFGDAAAADWPNHGGDRIWISPEQDTMIAERPDGSLGITIPPELDPAGYAVLSRDDDTCELRAGASIRFRRPEKTVDLEWTRRILVLPEVPYVNPDPVRGDASVAAIGYRVTTTLRAAEPPLPKAVHPAIWSIVQVPPGARITVPTHRGGRRIHAFIGTPVAEADDEGILTCDVRTDASFKFGLQIGDSRGVCLAELTGRETRTLVVREFERFPVAEYSDVPADDPSAEGYVHQIYVDDGALGGFGELEHHSPYLREENGYRITDVSSTCAYRGSADAIASVRANFLAKEEQA